jgi:hypothetical protein
MNIVSTVDAEIISHYCGSNVSGFYIQAAPFRKTRYWFAGEQ